MSTIQLLPVPQDEFQIMKREMQQAFMKGLEDSFPDAADATACGPLPTDEDYEQSFYDKDAIVRQFVAGGRRIGGVIVNIDEETQKNEVVFLYIIAEAHGKGIGLQAWQAVEAAFPKTKIWELYTPYFEKRNIHFYVNKCGFHIVEFQHKGNPGPNIDTNAPVPDEEYEFFRFEKVMANGDGV